MTRAAAGSLYSSRLDLPTLRVDPVRKIDFEYGSRKMTGLAGDSLASALFANGVRVFSRSLKYHRPRGLYSLDGESSNTVMEVDGLANVRTETMLLRPGVKVRAQNVFGSPERDYYGLLDHFGRLMPAGFYYRRFHKPYRLWPFFLQRIRKMAGMGRLDQDLTFNKPLELFLNVDVCVIGGGPAGLSAALAAARHGLRTALFEARPHLGGFYDWRAWDRQSGQSLHELGVELADAARGNEHIRIFTHAPVTGIWGDNQVTAIQSGDPNNEYPETYIELRAGSIVVASGCTERPLVFENNDRPGVMQPGCAWRLARTYGLWPGEKAVFAVGDDLGLEAAADLADLGLDVAVVADARTEGRDPDRVLALAERNIPFLPGWTASRAVGRDRVKGVVLTRLDERDKKTFDCDLLAASAGASPVIGPLSTAGAELAYDGHTHFFLPQSLPPRIHAAGRLLGLTDPEAIEASGRRAGLVAARENGIHVDKALEAEEKARGSLPGPARGCGLIKSPLVNEGAKAFVCFDEDATYKHIVQSAETGFDMPELAKRYSAAGTGPGQGGIPGHNLPLIMAELSGRPDAVPLPTTIRPPLHPILFNTLAGRGHDIHKDTPLARVQVEAGGVFRRIGVWKRARYFSDDLSCKEEVEAVRTAAGLIDVSTLGKFRVFGPDAVKALDRVYIGDMEKAPVGRVKYSAMLNDDGCLIDDGVVTKIGENNYYLTTSTGRAGQTAEWIRYHTKEEGWDFHLVNLTDALCAVNLAGPKSRDVIQRLTDADLSNEAFPYSGYLEITLAESIPARVMRLGFVGELSFEIHAPSSLAETLWERLLEAGREFGLRPFGLEAQNILRLEKGHVIIGQESEIRTNLHDLGMSWLWARHKTEAGKVGAPALRFAEDQTGRLKLVGIEMDENESVPPDGSLIVDDEIQGHVCTIRFSQTLNRTVGLALVKDHLARPGTRLSLFTGAPGEERQNARVVDTPFYDPQGERLRS